MERNFDGITFQYSLNGGATWINVGAFGDAVNCNTDNWFNHNNISRLTSIGTRHGWSGRVGPNSGSCNGTGGSTTWRVAKHCLTGTAGQSNVRFRFLFGSGTTCNNYDGIAIDDIYISNGIPNVANYNYNCAGPSTFNFTSVNAVCPAPGTWSWNFGDPASGASNTSTLQNPSHVFSAPGTYTVTMIVTGGQCNPPDTISQVITVVSASTAASNSPVCVNQSLTLFASGGTAYSWTGPNGFTSAQQNPVIAPVTAAAAGTYTVAVTLPSGCIENATVAVTVNALPVITSGSNSPICVNGTLNLTATGGGTYNWSGPNSFSSTNPNPNIASVTAASSGTYTLTVTGANSCVTTSTLAVTINALPVVVVGSNSPICATNTLNLTATGGGTYSWSGPNSFSSTLQNPNISNVSPAATGTYTVTVTGINGCVRTATISVTVGALPVVIAGNNSPLCENATLNLTSTGVGTYSWSGPNGFSSTLQNPSISNVTALATGIYTIAVTGANGCVRTNTTSVTVGALPLVTVGSNSPICGNGTLNLTSTGGGTYSWSGPNGFSSALQNPSIVNVTAAATGTYTVTVVGANGCVRTSTTSVTVGTLPIVTTGSNSPLCANETLNLTSTGGGTYSWSGPNGFSSTLQNPSVSGVTALATGIYTVTVTGANSCINTGTTSVTVGALPSVTAGNNSALCENGILNLTATGGGTYSWSGPNGFSSTLQNPSIVNITAAATGTYTVTVTGANLCVNTQTTSVTIAALPFITAGSNSPLCENETLNLTSSGGGTYSWTGPGGFSSALQNPSIASVTTAVTGIYTVTVTGANSCVNTATTSVSVSTLPVVTAGSNSPLCENGSLNLTSTGGGTYSWSGPNGFSSALQNPSVASVTPLASGTYTVTVTNSGSCINTGTTSVSVGTLPLVTIGNNSPLCENATLNFTSTGGVAYSWNGPNGFSSPLQNPSIVNVTPLATGVYTVTVTGANSCVNTGTTSVTIGALPLVTAGSNSPLCENGTLNLTSTGGGTYSWSGPNGYSSALQNTSIINVTAAATGIYTVTVTGTNSCVNTGTTTVVVGTLPLVTIGNNSPLCENATLNITSTGGGTYSWNGPNSFSSPVQNPSLTSITSSAAGIYTVTVTGVNSCVNTATTSVTVFSLPAITANSNSPICEGSTLNLSASGGTSYSWSGPNAFSSALQNPSITGATLPLAGTYTVTSTDVNGCINAATTSVVFSPSFPLTASVNSQVCEGESINLGVDAGISWSWSGPAGYTSSQQNPFLFSATSAMSGTYTVIATNSAGCIGRDSVSVLVHQLPTAIAGNNGPVCMNQSINLFANGGTVYSWTGPNAFVSGQQNPLLTNTTMASEGTYFLTVTDANGCSNTGSTNVAIFALPSLTASGSVVCENSSIQLSASGGTSYSWAGPGAYTSVQQNPSIANATVAMAGTYTVVATDANACSSIDSVSVLVNPLPIVNINSNSPVCENTNLDLTADGGLLYSWSGPNGFASANQNPQLATATIAAAGVYTVTVTDIFGCVNSGSTTVLVNSTPIPTAGSTSPVCETTTLNFFTGTVANQYAWSGPNGFTATQQNPFIATTSIADAGVYSLSVTDGNGCVGTTTIVVEVNANPIATASSNNSICLNGIILLTASGGTSYNWSGPGGFTSNQQNPVISNASNAGTSTYSVTVSSAGCSSSATTSVVVGLALTVNATTTSTSVCEGTGISLFATGSGGDNQLSYSWSPGGTTGTSLTTTPASTTVYTVTLSDGCGSPVATDTVEVIVNAIPVITLTQQSTGNCSPVHVIFNGTSFPAPAVCNWDFGDGTTSTNCQPIHSFFAPGNYAVNYTTTTLAGCSASASLNLDVFESPVADFTYIQQEDEIKEPIMYFDNISFGSGITLYSWDLGMNTGYDSVFNPSPVTYPVAGEYPVTLVVTNQWGCTDTVTKIIVIEESPTFYIPNAFSPDGDGRNDFFYPKGTGITELEIYIYDRWGEELFHSKDLNAQWDGRMKGKGSILPPDIYVWKIIARDSEGIERGYSGHVTIVR